jgi:hypothetical protein
VSVSPLCEQPALQLRRDVEFLDRPLDGALFVRSFDIAEQLGWRAFDMKDRPQYSLGEAAASGFFGGRFMAAYSGSLQRSFAIPNCSTAERSLRILYRLFLCAKRADQ